MFCGLVLVNKPAVVMSMTIELYALQCKCKHILYMHVIIKFKVQNFFDGGEYFVDLILC